MADQPRPSIDFSRPGAIAANGAVVLIIFGVAFLLVTAITGVTGDYRDYVLEWRSMLSGHEPWRIDVWPFDAYGPLFNLMAPTVSLSPLANKFLYSLAYILYLIWLAKVGPARPRRLPPWLWLGLLILNPFVWQQIAWMGYFDILVGLACVAAVHCAIERRERLSGVSLSLGILLKFMPVVLLPFLAVSGRRIHWRVAGACVGTVALGFLISVLIWGPATFTPLVAASTRLPDWSIYWVVNSAHPQVSAAIVPTNIDWLEKPLLLSSILAIFTLYLLGRVSLAAAATLASLTTFLFYREGFTNYQTILLCLLAYMLVREWRDDASHKLLGVLSILYFSFMALSDVVLWKDDWQPVLHPYLIVACGFVLGCLLLVSLLRASVGPAGVRATERP